MEIVINAYLASDARLSPESIRELVEGIGGNLLLAGAKKASCRMTTAEQLKKGHRNWGPGIFFLRKHYPEGLKSRFPGTDEVLMQECLSIKSPLALQAIIEPLENAGSPDRYVAAIENAPGMEGAKVGEYDIRTTGWSMESERRTDGR